MNTTKTMSAFAAIAVAVTLLSGCSAVAAVKNVQTKVQACTSIDKELEGVGTGISGETSKLESDPKGAAADISAMAKKFSAATTKLSNPQVKKAAEKAAGTLTVFAKDLTNLAATPSTANQTKLQADTTTLQAAFTAIDTTCKL
jgi:hypothetical protein